MLIDEQIGLLKTAGALVWHVGGSDLIALELQLANNSNNILAV